MRATDRVISPRVKIPTYDVISVNGVSCQKPVRVLGPATYENLTSTDFGKSPLDNYSLREASFEQALAVAGYALQRPENDTSVAEVIGAINKYTLTGTGIFLLSPLEALFIRNPPKDLVSQLGKNDQNVLSQAYWDARKQLKGVKEREGVQYGENVRMAQRENISLGEQTRDIFVKNPGVLLSTGDQEIAQDLKVGSIRYKSDPRFSLPFDEDKLVVAVPVLGSVGFDGRLCLNGVRDADGNLGCSFGVFESAAGDAPKKEQGV